MLREAGGKEISANIIVAITLAVKHHETEAPSYDIDEDYDKLEGTKTKYKTYDFHEDAIPPNRQIKTRTTSNSKPKKIPMLWNQYQTR